MLKDKDLQADASFLETAQADAHHVALHRSQVFRLETEELLNECCLELDNISWGSHQHDYLNTISNLVSKFPGGTKSLDDCPFDLRSKKITSFEMPKGADFSITPIGSYALDCLTKKAGNANVIPTLDCAIVVPNSVWNTKDYLDHRYIDKRNIILWNISKFLSENKFKKKVGSVQWRYYNGNPYILSLILTPPEVQKSQGHQKKKNKTSHIQLTRKKFRFQFVMAMQSLEWIPIPRLFPNRSNVKGSKRSTYYNAMLVRDATWVQAGDTLKEDIDELPHFRKSLVLTKIWLLQRGFLRGRDSLDDSQVAILLLYIYRSKKATSRMPPLQVFTALIRLLASDEFRMAVSVLPSADNTEAQTIASCKTAKIYLKNVKESPLDSKNGDPKTLIDCYRINSTSSGMMLLDSKMLGNYLENLSPSFCDSLQLQATRTLSHLNSTGNFKTLFMINTRFWNSLDAYTKINMNDFDWDNTKKLGNWDGNSPSDLGQIEYLSRKLSYMLKRALGDRIIDLRILTSGNGCNVSTVSNEIDSDEIPTWNIKSEDPTDKTETLVIGLKINAETCHRAVDRGPPAESVAEVREFEKLWGDVVELRRFKDGAIVHAVVWDSLLNHNAGFVYEGVERTQGGIVECIVQHIIGLHFCKEGTGKKHKFLLRDIVGLVDGPRTHDSTTSVPRSISNSTLAHRNILNAFDALANVLRRNSEKTNRSDELQLGLPLPIDAVEPLSASLRYSDPFPPIPHPLLGGSKKGGKISMHIPYTPIKIQIRFGSSSKWPNDIKSIGAAKTAMLIQLADGIEAMKKQRENCDFAGPIIVTPSYLLLGFRGYSWKIVVRADPELYILRGLHKPNNEALSLLYALTKEHITSSSHHSTIHAVHTLYPSAGHVVRLFQQWLATHMLSGLIPFEAVELLVAKVYSDGESPTGAPSSILSGFLRVLHLLGTHDWINCPMIVDPQGHLEEKEISKIHEQFQKDRSIDMSKGPNMYIVAAYDCIDSSFDDNEEKNAHWSKFKLSKPSFTASSPEKVVLFRATTLAQRSYKYLLECLHTGGDWTGAFQETRSSLKSYSLLMRIDRNYAVDNLLCSTGEGFATKQTVKGEKEMKSIFSQHALAVYEGSKILQRKVYRNLNSKQMELVLHDWNPIRDTVHMLRKQLGSRALFFYNEFAPQVIAVLWRPTTFKSITFSVMNSEFLRPVSDSDWKKDTLGISNANDIVRLLRQVSRDVVIDMKILDSGPPQAKIMPKNKRSLEEVDSASDSEEDESDSDDTSTDDSNESDH